jgi:ATP-dependent Zn protease
MVTQYGMSDKVGFQLFGHDESRNPWEQPDRQYSEETARQIDQEVHHILDAKRTDRLPPWRWGRRQCSRWR